MSILIHIRSHEVTDNLTPTGRWVVYGLCGIVYGLLAWACS